MCVVATVIILLFMPRSDHQSYNYELNQPWKYPLLTAELDMPIMRDSASAKTLRDSIDAQFVPFVVSRPEVGQEAVARFRKGIPDTVSASERNTLAHLMETVYKHGIVDADIYAQLRPREQKRVRMVDSSSSYHEQTVTSVDASKMLSPARAYAWIDSVYSATLGSSGSRLNPASARALSVCLQPDITSDSVADAKYRSQEYLDVNSALGVIKKGQRIVDRGEIITPQVYTNLNTYLELLDKNTEASSDHYYYYIGQALVILITFAALYCFLFIYRPRFINNIRKMAFLITFITAFVIFAILMFEYVRDGMMMVPFAALPVVVLVFFDARTAIFSLITTVIIATLTATFQFQFIFLELMVGLFATFSIHQLTRRSQLLRTGLVSFFVYLVGYFAFCLLTSGNLAGFSWRMVTYFAVNSVILSFTYVLIFVIEKLFGFTSMVTLVELSDINNPLLRRLAEEAPGTFQHSMQVSTLAAEGARAIGANMQLVRTGALYHDIGKLESPIFFTENQHGVNPHSGLNPETSAQKIISHVTGGMQTALREKLPAEIRHFITEHHGRGVAKYFYNTAVNECPEGQTVDRSKFEYPGPNPQTKETAILMMADAVEAASRSLSDYSPAALDALVENIVNGQAAEGMFKESPISYRDIETVKATFKKRLSTMYHSRIAYPTLKAEK